MEASPSRCDTGEEAASLALAPSWPPMGSACPHAFALDPALLRTPFPVSKGGCDCDTEFVCPEVRQTDRQGKLHPIFESRHPVPRPPAWAQSHSKLYCCSHAQGDVLVATVGPSRHVRWHGAAVTLQRPAQARDGHWTPGRLPNASKIQLQTCKSNHKHEMSSRERGRGAETKDQEPRTGRESKLGGCPV